MKKFMALVLSLVMALSLCVPAWAEGDTMLGKGTETDPYIIEDAADLTAISNMYDGEYTYFKVADGVETLDLTGINKLKLNGSFDGNGVTLNNLTTALFQTVGKVGVAQEIKISNFTANVHTTDGRALVRNIYNPGTTIFENVTMHGYIEGQSNMGSFYNYGTANAGGSEGADYTVSFVNAKSDVTLVCTTGNVMGGMLGHGYEGANYQLSIEMDENSGYTGKMSTVGGKTCYQVMAMCSHATYMLNGVETSRYEKTYPSTALTVAAPEKTVDGYHVAPIDGVDHYVVFVNAQMSAYDDNGENIANLAGMTWPLGNKTISATNGKVFDLITDAKIVNSVEHDLGYAMDDGTLTIYSGRRENYASGWITLQVNQYDAENNLLATGNLEVYRFAEPEEFYTVSFDANGGCGEMNSLARTDAVKFTLPENGFTAPEGMKFKGWATSADGDVITDTLYAVTGNETLYAIWEADIVEVPKTDEETVVEIEAVITGDKVTITGVENLTTESFEDANTDSVTLDLSKVETSVSTVVIPTEVVSGVKEVVASTAVDSLKIVTAEATVTLDAAAIAAINKNAEDANASSVSLTVDVQPVSTATDVGTENREAFAEVMEKDGSENAMLLSIELVGGDEEIFSEGKAAGTASVKVKLANGLKSATLYYLDGDEAVKMGSYNADTAGYVTVTLKHFSEYVLLGSTDTIYSGYYPVVGGTTTTPVADETVTSPKTFDAGIALYVGMSVAAAVGTVTLGKKRED